MLLAFIDSTEKGLTEMQDAIKSGRSDSIAELAHKMLPPARHIGASELFDLLKKIEANIKQNGEFNILENLINESFSEFEAVRELINEQIAKIS